MLSNIFGRNLIFNLIPKVSYILLTYNCVMINFMRQFHVNMNSDVHLFKNRNNNYIHLCSEPFNLDTPMIGYGLDLDLIGFWLHMDYLLTKSLLQEIKNYYQIISNCSQFYNHRVSGNHKVWIWTEFGLVLKLLWTGLRLKYILKLSFPWDIYIYRIHESFELFIHRC